MGGMSYGTLYIVGNHNNGYLFLFVQVLYNMVKLVGCHRVKGGNRLVQKQNGLCGAQGTGKQNSLLLSSGKLVITAVFKIFNAQLF